MKKKADAIPHHSGTGEQCLKHAAAKNLVIELIADSEGHAVDLTISDDGKGFRVG